MRSGSSHEDKFLILSIVKAHSWNIQKALFWDGSVCTLAALGRPCIPKWKSWSYLCKSTKLCGAALTDPQVFSCFGPLFSKCGAESVDPWKYERLAKLKQRKCRGIWEQRWGSQVPSCLSLEVVTLYNPFNECIKLLSILKLLFFPTPEPPASHCHLKWICGQLRPICSCANADFPSVAFLIGHIPTFFLLREGRNFFFVHISAWGFGNRKDALSNKGFSRSQCLLFKRSKYIS